MPQNDQFIAPSSLHMDIRNPRAGAHEFADEDAAVAHLIATADIDEIVRSIQSAGWIDYEPLIVEQTTNVVLEGNRRLAAIRLMTEPALRSKLNYTLPENAGTNSAPAQVRIRYVANRAEARSFIAFKHINGPAKWDAFAKARYAKEWLDDGADLATVSNAVGDNHSTVLRLVNGLTVLNQAVALGFDRDDITARTFNFSHLYTALSRPNVKNFLKIPEDVGNQLPANPVPPEGTENLQRLMGWLFGQQKLGQEHVVKTQNPDLGKLVRVLAEPRAMTVLDSEKSLRLAFEQVEPPSYRFEETLKATAISAERTLGLLSHFDPSTQAVLMDTTEKLAGTVRVLRNEMRTKMAQDDDL
ncbi:hypothetical protein ACIPPQ_19435 [Sphingopyxis sp. LARHCG72]